MNESRLRAQILRAFPKAPQGRLIALISKEGSSFLYFVIFDHSKKDIQSSWPNSFVMAILTCIYEAKHELRQMTLETRIVNSIRLASLGAILATERLKKKGSCLEAGWEKTLGFSWKLMGFAECLITLSYGRV